MPSQNGPDTDQLLQRAQHCDQAAQSELLDRYRSRLRRMVAVRLDGRLASRVDPSDVVQEAMRDAYQRLPDYLEDPQRTFYVWIRQITWDRLTDMHRRHISAAKRTVSRERRWTPPLNDDSVYALAGQLTASSLNPERKAVQVEMIARVRAALDELAPSDREIIVLRYLEQLAVEEIAEVLEISKTAVTTRNLRALQRLRRQLGEE